MGSENYYGHKFIVKLRTGCAVLSIVKLHTGCAVLSIVKLRTGCAVLSQTIKYCTLTQIVLLYVNTWSVRKVSDRIFLCEHLMDYNLARLHEPTLNLSAHA